MSCGLRQGCSVSPMLFRWILEDILAELEPEWQTKGYGVDVNGRRPYILCWADVTWAFAESADALDSMIASIQRIAARKAGLHLRLQKCTWTAIQRKGTENPAFEPNSRHAALTKMGGQRGGECLRILGTHVQFDGNTMRSSAKL